MPCKNGFVLKIDEKRRKTEEKREKAFLLHTFFVLLHEIHHRHNSPLITVVTQSILTHFLIIPSKTTEKRKELPVLTVNNYNIKT